jgi:pimeloyl-ACP methyl ester carboxylesterase
LCSGLGADERVFEHLVLPGCSLIHLPWITPERKEPIAHYAGRMNALVRHENPVLMGLSFGGIMAVEMSRLLPIRRLWLLSSVKERRELPGYMRFGKHLPLHKLLLPLNPQRRMGPFENYNLGVETLDERTMVNEFRKRVDPFFLRWSINAIISWEAPRPPGNTFHIHGGNDRIFPVALAHPDRVVPGAGHFMAHNRAPEVSRYLLEDARGLIR